MRIAGTPETAAGLDGDERSGWARKTNVQKKGESCKRTKIGNVARVT